MKELYKKLKNFGKVRLNELLSRHSTIKIGGTADFFVIVDSVENLVKLLRYLQDESIEYIVIGGGSNILFSEDRFEGVVIKIKNQKLKIKNNIIEAEAGAPTALLAQESIKNSLTGFEWGVGVPGTIGGAVRGNAGAMGREMKDFVEKVEVFRNGEVVELANFECEFNYRDSIFKHNDDIILKVFLKLQKSDNKDLAKKAMETIAYRNETQPKEHSSGCVFKNVIMCEITNNTKLRNVNVPDEFAKKGKIPAGWLVEQVGMKGAQAGMAKVSEKHGNFIVNLGGATASDVLALVEKIKEKVYDKFGIELEEEIQVVNF